VGTDNKATVAVEKLPCTIVFPKGHNLDSRFAFHIWTLPLHGMMRRGTPLPSF
jgi:hypothetical protein